MPTQVSSAIASVTTENSTVGNALFRRRHTNGRAQAETATLTLQLGRDRHMTGMTANTEVFALATVRRDRVVIGLTKLQTETSGNKLASMPAVLAPVGMLWLNGKPLAEQTTLQKNQSLSMRFELTGKKLLNLSARLKIFNLQRETLIEKLETVSPGGLEIESETIKLGGLTNYIGYLFIDRIETQFAGQPREFELEYEFEIGNSKMNYPIERGFLTFVG